MTAPSSWATSRPNHSERWLFSHLFFSMLCLRLSKNCSAFFCLLVRSLPLSLPPPLSLSFDIAAIDVSNWACCFASSFFCLRGLQGEPFNLSPVLGTAVRVLAVLVPLVLLPRKACLEQSGPGGFEDLLLYLAEGRHEVQGRGPTPP